MTDETILTEVLFKARANGYWRDRSAIFSFIYNWKNACEPIEPLIFSHDFAKAFWGEFKGDGKMFADGEAPDGFTDSGFPKCKRDWRFHIQKMALEKEPLEYLEKFL